MYANRVYFQVIYIIYIYIGSKLKADILRDKSGEIFKIMCTTNKGKKTAS